MVETRAEQIPSDIELMANMREHELKALAQIYGMKYSDMKRLLIEALRRKQNG